MAYDGIVNKKIIDELSSIKNYKIDKIYEPDKNTVILGLYGNYTNLALLLCISSNNYRIHLTTHTIKNPDVAPNFCMLLRKHILGYKIKNIYTKSLERIAYIELVNEENIEKPIYKTLIVELMGKHSNIILVDSNNIIIDSIRHTSAEENAQRDIYPTAKYFSPNISKLNLLEFTNFEEFYTRFTVSEESEVTSKNEISKQIANTFNGLGLSNINYIFDNMSKKSSYKSVKLLVHSIYDELMSILNSSNLCLKVISYKNNVPHDYCICLCDKSTNKNSNQDQDKNQGKNQSKTQTKSCNYNLNFSLDDFYFLKESNEIFTNYRNTLLNIILATLKKYEKRLVNIDDKLSECKNMDRYKLYGELITANLYKIPSYNLSSISLENYYDENKLIEIPLDKKYSPQYNAKLFYKKYNKLKNALDIINSQKKETLQEIDYIESTIYELDNCSSIEDVQLIYDEISETNIFKNSITRKNINKKSSRKKPAKFTSNKYASYNPLKYIIDGYTIYVGRNNKENDYLTNKFASKNDLWFHTKDTHGSHVILKIPHGEKVTENIIYEAAKLACKHSKAKNSSNVPVDYCLVQFVKKVPGNKPGLVIYRNNKTIYIN